MESKRFLELPRLTYRRGRSQKREGKTVRIFVPNRSLISTATSTCAEALMRRGAAEGSGVVCVVAVPEYRKRGRVGRE
jgi:hypothetical protein